MRDDPAARTRIDSGITEKKRNKLLRRVDWRFLLSSVRWQSALCFERGDLMEAVELVSNSIAFGFNRDRESGSQACDLAVAVNPSVKVLRSAWRSLRMGGCFYTEWYWPAGSARIRRHLEAAGYEVHACYWAWPLPAWSQARFWINLEADGARQHFLASRPLPRTWIRRMGSPILRTIWHLALRLGRESPICAVASKPLSKSGDDTARPSGPSTTSVEPPVLTTIRDHWSTWNLRTSPERLSWSLMTGGARTINKIIGLVFAEPDPDPVFAVKMPRVPESVASLEREATVLRALHGSREGGVAGVPRVLFWDEVHGVPTLIETALTGIPLMYLMPRREYRKRAIRVMEWLVDLADSPGQTPREEWWGRLVVPTVGTFAKNFGPILDPGMLREAENILSSLSGLSIACEQRDFSPWNVLMDKKGQFAVLDWESAELKGLSGLDAIYFMVHATFFLEHANRLGQFRRSYRRMLDVSTFSGAVASECLQCYAERTGMNPGAFRPLRVLAWMLHSRSEYVRFIADSGAPPSRKKLRASVFFQLWEDELRYGR